MNEPRATYEWKQIPWRKVEVSVFKLQRRIYRASQSGEIKKVHQLQRLLLKSRSARLLAVRRVSQDNQGKSTAGIDGVKSLTPRQRMTLAENLEQIPVAKPLRRVWIPKSNRNEKRPLGIPTLNDRAVQALVKSALEPQWEAKFEPNSYGFRPGRSSHDAIGAVFIAIGKKPKYVLDADISKCFDRIGHQALLSKLQTFPRLRRLIKRWLSAGVLDQSSLVPTQSGTPQGGVISPLLANIALHGLEEHIRSQFPATVQLGEAGNRRQTRWEPQMIRYADDIVVLHRNREAIEKCRRIAEEWLANIGLELNHKKTRIGHTLLKEEGKAGFDFLGFTIRQYRASKYNTRGRGFKTLIRPSRSACKRHYKRLSECIKSQKATKQENLIKLLNPKIVGWSNYYRYVVSRKAFEKLDYRLYIKLARWARFRHPKKSKSWIARRYWRQEEGKNWVFRAEKGFALSLHSNSPIVRHPKIRGTASPFDGNWSYWASRQGSYPGLRKQTAKTLKRQKGRCLECGLVFLPEARIELHHLDGEHSNNRHSNLSVLHRHCHDSIHGASGRELQGEKYS